MKKNEKAAHIATLLTIAFMLCWGAVIVIARIKPFWVDEWRLIYNLKFKDSAALWGPLDYTQQFPRVYLQLIKWFTARFDYSYFSLRVPAYLTAAASMWLSYSLMRRIFPSMSANRYLFVLILISSQTFTDYFVQIKHYEMEIFLSLVAIWQLLELLELQDKGIINNKRYVILCLSLLVVPFFSYTYPIAIAPVFAILLIRSIWANGEIKFKHSGFRQLARLWLPMVICSLSILVFYIIDVSQLMADRNMNEYWSYRMAKGNFRLLPILEKLWRLFAEVGAGFVFELIFGALGVCAFIYAVRAYVLNYQALRHDKAAMLRLYAIILLVIVIGLFLAGKLPVGEPKFNAFTVPSISILILFLLNDLLLKKNTIRFSGILTLVLFLGLTGNILSTFINNFTAPEYKKRMDIFVSTEQAILLARTSRIPIFTTSQVAFPDSININTPHLITITPDCVLKTFPAYNVNDKILVYAIRDLAQIEDCFRLLPPEVKTALAGDGLTFRLVKRK